MTTEAITPLRQRMIEDMNARKLGKHTQRGHIYSCRRFVASYVAMGQEPTSHPVGGRDAEPPDQHAIAL